uniref:Coronin n=2 Tax=Ascaris TaxID=6251 RepID=A0A9J2PCA8_ASCLU
MSVNIVRQSKFRHVFCKPVKHEQCMSDIRITEITWESLFCAVNPKFIAIIVKGSGGPFQVIPVTKVGRIDKDYPFVDAHRAPCLEVVWNPFNDNVIASCSEDATAKVWLIPPNGLTRILSEPVVELNGHQKRVNTLAWHPTANNILLTAGGENKLLMWNVGTGEALLEIAGHPDQIWSLSFNYDGSRFVTTCKDKQLRVIDSHSGEVLFQGQGHEGVKPQRAIFLRDGRIFTTGFTKRSERLYALRYQEKLEEPIIQEELDTSNGVLFPLYDEDTGLIYLCGKGDCAIRYYEVNNEYPFVHYINTYTTSEPQRGIAFMPKLGINSNENECARIYKVTTKGIVDNLQFFVPRKSDLFQADLYPPTRSPVPAMSAEQFIQGMNAPPNLIAVNPAAAEAKPKVHVAKKANILASLQPTQPEISSMTRSEDSTPQRSPRIDDGGGASRFDEMPQQQRTPRKQPVMDEDMGIVRVEQRRPVHDREPQLRSPERASNSMAPRQQVQLRSRSDRDDGAQTAGQRRATAELERIRREQAREPDRDELIPRAPQSAGHSPRHSMSAANEPSTMEELLSDLHKMKAILRQHERRIRLLEDQLADKNMADTYGF